APVDTGAQPGLIWGEHSVLLDFKSRGVVSPPIMTGKSSIHVQDCIRKTRDAVALSAEEIAMLVGGAADGSIPDYQLSAWLMAVTLRGITTPELQCLTREMRASGDQFDPSSLGKFAVDKHSTGGVGDKTSFLVAPIAAAAGLLVPMISGRALGHTGGTLDKLESVPGLRTRFDMTGMRRILEQVGACIVGQSETLVPADRKLYGLRDVTATVESPDLICASIMSKKLAAGLNGLVLDVKTGSGAFLKSAALVEFLAAQMVATGEASGTRTVALLTDMEQPLGLMSGNAVEIIESVSLLRNERHPLNEDLRTLSITLAAWMLFLGGAAATVEGGEGAAENLLASGDAYEVFCKMVSAQGGDPRCFDDPESLMSSAIRTKVRAPRNGHVAGIDCEKMGWAVQRLGAGRERAEDRVSPLAGMEMHAKLGSEVRAGEPLCTLFADNAARFPAAEKLLLEAISIGDEAPKGRPLIGKIITRENCQEVLQQPRPSSFS
ncbi:MAG: thymidine phosphorylase, partial [Acidobacteriaceae bacterium]